MLRFVFPGLCFACRRELRDHQALGACATCWAGLRPLGPHVCPTCSLPRPPMTDLLGPARGRCARCILDPPRLSSARAAVAYDDVARRFLLRAKLGLRRELLPKLAVQLVLTARGWPDLGACDVMVPVPSRPWARLRRGFDPAYELARPLARSLGLPLGRRLLLRRHSLRAMKQLGAEQRRREAHSAFRSRFPARGARVLLVDDVMTTGATLAACSEALLEAGAAGVHALVWARAL